MPTPTPRVGARVLLLDPDNRVLLIHSRDPDQPTHHWWELPGGGQHEGETLHDTVRRELAEETGLHLDHIGPHLWTRESRFHYRGRDHHRIDHVYLAHTPTTTPTHTLQPSANEKLGLIERRWWTPQDLTTTPDKLLPTELPQLVKDITSGWTPDEPLTIK